MDTWRQDLWYAVRMLVKKPGFTTVAVLSLALGIGANTAIFTVIKAVFLQPLAIEEPSRVVELFTRDTRTCRHRRQFQADALVARELRGLSRSTVSARRIR